LADERQRIDHVLVGADVVGAAAGARVAVVVGRHRGLRHARADGRGAGLQVEVVDGGVDEQRVDDAAGGVVGNGAAGVVQQVGAVAAPDDVVAQGGVGGAAGVADADGGVVGVEAVVDGVVVDLGVGGAVLDGDASAVVPDQVVVGQVAVPDVQLQADVAGEAQGPVVVQLAAH